MKTSILKVVAAIVFVCCLLNFTAPLLKNTSPAWINLDSLSLRHNFYFGKGQWLADARTIMAGIRYLYRSTFASPTNQMNVGSIPDWLDPQPGISTNLLATEGTDSTILPHERRLSRAECLIVRKRLLSSCGLPPFACVDTPLCGLHGLPSANWVMKNHVIELRTRILRFTTLPTNAAAPRLRNCPSDAQAMGLQGA